MGSHSDVDGDRGMLLELQDDITGHAKAKVALELSKVGTPQKSRQLAPAGVYAGTVQPCVL